MPALALLLAPVASCVSFRVSPPDTPELTVAYVALLAQVDEKADFGHEIPSQPVQPGAEAVCALVKIQTIRRPVSLVWRWYAPDGSLARRSPPVLVNARRTELEHAVAWDRLPRGLFSKRTGSWQVVISADERFLARKEFQVPPEAGASPSQSPP